ncbi:STAS/SEC14 domain-containing protein [Sphingomonas paucimobilis]|uniref:STAS/SEC14 domain-containing protein n=1 Tax=Sphingomonas paucimobilis TaxID=13689 RepID=A0A7Y2KS39_SPHPI|nr:STAS/SEC14 domain-containing protein [Sphingomonas paucimobilis]NNG58590.1 STAS/SEC14 domain-containing protein [Sphingomonas paucimobilis]
MFTVAYVRSLNLLDIEWSGLIEAADVSVYAAECRARLRRERFGDGYLLRIVRTDNLPLPQDALFLLLTIFDDFPKAAQTAIVATGAVAKLQIRQVMTTSPSVRLFEDATAALDWLKAHPSS